MYRIENIINEAVSRELQRARKDVDKSPTDAEIKAGNYKKGHVKILGFQITIENPKGSYRKGKDRNGKEWKTLMHNDYGYFVRTLGKDGDAIDVFIGPNLKSEKIFPIDQYINGQFDETKVMLGFDSAEEAKKAYLSNYEKDWKGFKYITEVDLDTFKKWLYDGKRQRKPFAKYETLNENMEMVNEMALNEAQGLKSKKLYDIFKTYGREFIAKHYDSSEAMDLHNVSDNDVVGVFKAGQLPRTEGEEKAWINQMGFDADSADGVRNIKLGKLADDGQILYAVVINRNGNYDRTSAEKDGGFKDYVNKQNARAERKRGDGSRNYQWKDNSIKFDVMDNPYRKEWSSDAQQQLRNKMAATYGKRQMTEAQKHKRTLTENDIRKIIRESIEEYFAGNRQEQAAYENAKDCLYYGYGFKFWLERNSELLGNDSELAKRIWIQAKNELGDE